MDAQITYFRCKAYASKTKSVYSSQINRFLRFCSLIRACPVPVDKVTISRYIVYLTKSCKYRTILCYLSAVKFLHKEFGFYNSPDTSEWEVCTLLMGVKRLCNMPARQKLPITPEILLMFYKNLSMKNPKDVCFWAACTTAFFGFFRKSTILLPKYNAQSFDPHIELSILSITESEWGFNLTIKKSKTIQSRDREVIIPFIKIYNSPLCPVQALMSHLLCNKPKSTEPLFSFQYNDEKDVLTQYMFDMQLKKILSFCNLSSKDYSGHSFRRGGATHAFLSGLPTEFIKAQGDWKSDAYTKYISIPISTRVNFLKTFTSNIP